MVFNDLEHGRHRLVLAAAWPNPAKADSSQPAKSNYSPWKTIAVLEDETASTTNPKEEFSYPYMSLNQQGQVLLVYTWNRKRIKSILWDAGYLQSYLQHIKSEMDRSQ
jgi:predicted neuraminidase